MDLKLNSKTAFISGSYRGTGRAIAQTLAREGVQVLIHGFETGQAEPVAQELCDAGMSAGAVTGDLMSDEGADDLLAQAKAAYGGVDILVNNYGTAEAGSWKKSGASDWVAAYEKNVLSAVRLSQRMLPYMKENGWGRIIHLGTIGSTQPAARMPHYYAAKGALATLNVSLAKELANTGITVNLVSPGLIRTAEVEASFRALAEKKGWGEDWSEIARKGMEKFGSSLTGGMPDPQEIADAVAFLASPLAANITATNMRIDGGATALVT